MMKKNGYIVLLAMVLGMTQAHAQQNVMRNTSAYGHDSQNRQHRAENLNQLENAYRAGDNDRGVEYLHKLSPSALPNSEAMLAQAPSDQKAASKKGESAREKAEALVKSGFEHLKNNQYLKAAQDAKQAISLYPESSGAHLLLAYAYDGGASSQCSDFERSTVNFLALDHVLKARRYSPPDDPRHPEYTRLVGKHAARVPKSEECFMRGINENDEYTVRCGWINEKTRIWSR